MRFLFGKVACCNFFVVSFTFFLFLCFLSLFFSFFLLFIGFALPCFSLFAIVVVATFAAAIVVVANFHFTWWHFLTDVSQRVKALHVTCFSVCLVPAPLVPYRHLSTPFRQPLVLVPIQFSCRCFKCEIALLFAVCCLLFVVCCCLDWQVTTYYWRIVSKLSQVVVKLVSCCSLQLLLQLLRQCVYLLATWGVS